MTFLALSLSYAPRLRRPQWGYKSYLLTESSEFVGAEFAHQIAKAAPALSHLHLGFDNLGGRGPRISRIEDSSFWSIRRDEAGVVVLES